MNEKIIEVKKLVKRYKNASTNAVDGVSFYVEEGAFFSLLGPNGAGKTTIISILTTLLKPTGGEVTLDGMDMEKQAEKIRQKIGVIFQKPSLDINLTAEENIRFHANLYNLFPYRPSFKMMSSEYQKRVEMLADVLGLDQKLLHSPVKNLSGGMKRKLEIIRSLMHKPKVLFLDEPTTGLDPASRRSLWKYLQQIREEDKVTIFLTTHYLEEAEGADYICIVDNGKIVAQGSPGEIKERLIEKYLIIDSSEKEKLAALLDKLKVKHEGEGPYKIWPGKLGFQEIIKSIPIELDYIDIHNPTLEDAYLEIIGKE